jgi:hypothetical protein
MKRKKVTLSLALLSAGVVGSALAQGCSSSFGTPRSQAHLLVTIEAGNRGTPDNRNPLSFDAPNLFTVKVAAQRPDGTIDTSFNGFVRFSAKPGTVLPVSGANTDGRNVKLVAGVADQVSVPLVGAYGDTRIWVQDDGFVPGDPTMKPQCADGVDNNGNGLIDFPADPGCAFANDDSEDLGTYVAGISEPLYFVSPRIADVRGVLQGGAATSFPHEQVEIDTGYRGGQTYEFDTIITRVSSDGFYATDLSDPRGYNSIFAFNFSAPPRMRICDRLKTFGGTSSDFFGFTEVNYPTWTLEEWDPTQRECMVPDPIVLSIDALDTSVGTQALLKVESSLVRVETAHVGQSIVDLKVASKFGRGDAPYVTNADKTLTFNFTPDASNCDLNRDGKVDFNTEPEKSCGNQCSADPECSEYSSFQARSEFRLVLLDTTGGGHLARNIAANGSTSPQFDALSLKGKTIRSFTGTLRYFSGGNQFTIEARCDEDIVADPAQSPASNKACVHERTTVDLNAGSN